MANPIQTTGFWEKLSQMTGAFLEKKKLTKQILEEGKQVQALTAEESKKAASGAGNIPTNFFDSSERELVSKTYQRANQVASGVSRVISRSDGKLNEVAINMLKNYGMTAERVSFLESTEMYKNPTLLKREIRKARVTFDRQAKIRDLEGELAGYYSPEQLNGINAQRLGIRKKYAQDADASVREEYRMLRNNRDTAVKIIREKGGLLQKPTDLQDVWRFATTLREKLSSYAELAEQAGLKTVAQKALAMDGFTKYAEGIGEKMANLEIKLVEEAKLLREKHFAGNIEQGNRFISDYIENITKWDGMKARPLSVQNGMAIGSIEANEKAMLTAATQHGVTMTEELANDVAMFANKQQNIYRTKMKAWNLIAQERFSEVADTIPNRYDEVSWSQIVDKTGNYAIPEVMGDIGVGYLPRILTPEAAQKARVRDFGSLAEANAEDAPRVYVNTVAARKYDERMWEDGKWLGIAESLEHSMKTGNSMMFKRFAQKHMQELSDVSRIMGPAGNSAMPPLEAIQKNFNDIYTFSKNENSFMAEIVGLVTDTNKKMFLANPFAPALNMFQLPLNNVTTSPFVLLKSYLKNTGNLVRVMSMNHKAALDGILNQETGSEIVRYCRQNYFRNYYPNASNKATMNIDIPGRHPLAKQIREVTDLFTFFFEAADISTRLVAADATAMTVEAALKKHGAKKLTSPANYIADMSKELSLGVFEYGDRKQLINLMLGDDRVFAAEFTNATIDRVLFNYNKLNRQQFVDVAKKNRYAADAASFMSFPFYSISLYRGAVNAAIGGDMKPLARMAGTMAVFLTAAQIASKSNDPITKQYGEYVKNSTVGMALFPVSAPNRPIGGVLNTSLTQIFSPVVYGMKEVSNLTGFESGVIEYMARNTDASWNRHPAKRMYKLFEDEFINKVEQK